VEHIVRISCLFCFLLNLPDILTSSNDFVRHQSYPFILIGLKCFCEFSRISFRDFVFHSVLVFIGLPCQKHVLPTSTVNAGSGTR
jgi:hypothetical protein